MPEKVAFHVVHASGQDENFRASELNTHSPLTRGWSSSRFCLYPQDIVVQLGKRCRMRKIQILSHQYLIASRIEFYVGDISPDSSTKLQNARYTRLGYVALSGNEQTDFKARELKSVHVDAVGIFLKLVIHKNHVNKYNLYNQVGLIAVNVIGDDLEKISKEPDPQLTANSQKPDYISPLDDLAFDMYQDQEVAQIIRKLEKKKQQSVLGEKYDFAKRLKAVITELQKVGERLGKFEVEKRQAVENEDYDKAKLKKIQMDDYRLQKYKELEIYDLVQTAENEENISPRHSVPPQRLKELNDPPVLQTESTKKPSHPSPLPALQHRSASDISITSSMLNRFANRVTAIEVYAKNGVQPFLVDNANKGIAAEENFKPEDFHLVAQDSTFLPIADANNGTPVPSPRTTKKPVPGRKVTINNSSNTPRIIDPNDDRPLPTHPKEPVITGQPSPRNVSDRNEQALPEPKPSYEVQYNSADDADKSAIPAETSQTGGQTDRSEGHDNQMSEKDLREAGFVIDIFGLELVQKAYSRNWSNKEECLADLVEHLSEYSSNDREESKNVMKAATFLLQKLLKDSVHAVFKACLNALKFLLTVFVPRHKIPKHDIQYCVDKTFPELLHKTGDTTLRIRTEAKAFIIEMAESNELKATHVVPVHCVKPFKLNVAPRLGQSHVEVVDDLYTHLGDTDSGLTVDNMMKFCVNALKHHSGSVRSTTELLIIKLYKQHRSAVKSYLPPDNGKTRRNTLYRQLFEAFDRIDGKPSKKEQEKQRQSEEAEKKAEVEALQQQIAQMKAMTSLATNNANKKPSSNKPPPNNARRVSLAPDDDAVSNITKLDRTCIFCNEQNEDFTDEGLDLHYWKNCPMLKRCSNCKQVTEIAGLTEHLLTECDAKGQFSKCPRCTEAIPKSEFSDHVKAKACNPADPKKSHCPLCHENIPSGDAAWMEHLMSMSPDACKQNPRRLAAYNKNKAAKSVNKKPNAKTKAVKVGKK